ncbi:MAG: ferritin [Melioribacteraceae bacterium]
MISKKMQDALTEQLNKEMFSSYLYLSMAAYFERNNLAGMSSWMRLQSVEEHEHAMKFYDFIIKVGGHVKLKAIAEPQSDWKSAQIVFEDALAHEQYITKNINELTDLAIGLGDHATKTFLHWFVDEQVEEEDTVHQIVDSFKLIGDSKSALFLFDRELGARAQTGEEN